MRITLEEQVLLAEKYADDALDALTQFLAENREVVRRSMLLRIATEGIETYGDETWFRADHELQAECTHELADGVFYLIPIIARLSGEHLLRTPKPH